MIELHTLASGSSGNALLLSRDGTHLLLDAGISCRRIAAGLGQLGLTLRDLTAVLITHTHSDHISGLQTLVNRCEIPIYASRGTAGGLAYRIAGIEPVLRPFAAGETLTVGGITVTPFETSHDAPGSTGYRMDDTGVLTDTGYVTREAEEVLSGVSLLVLESNHDVDLLRSGPYPYYLKKRILSDQGHLSNEAAGAFAVTAARAGAREIVLAHLSKENNTPQTALSAVSAALRREGFSPRLSVAPRDTLSEAYTTREALECSG